LSIRNYKYNHDWFTRCVLAKRIWVCGKDRIVEKENPVEKNEGDMDLRSM